jgi:hypothetical protein
MVLFSTIFAVHHDDYDWVIRDFSLFVSERFVRGDEEYNHTRGLQDHSQGWTCAFLLPGQLQARVFKCAQDAKMA